SLACADLSFSCAAVSRSAAVSGCLAIAGSYPPTDVSVSQNPEHSSTGNRGYLGNLPSTSDKSHREKIDPRDEVIRRAWTHLSQSPALVGARFTDDESSGLFTPASASGCCR